jgi:hypothetical protein
MFLRKGGSPLLQQGELDFSPAAEILAPHGLSAPGISVPAIVRPLTESDAFLIETPKRLKITVTHCKQKEAMHSNRVRIAPPFDRFFSLGTREK